jgi:hypothetical protein
MGATSNSVERGNRRYRKMQKTVLGLLVLERPHGAFGSELAGRPPRRR